MSRIARIARDRSDLGNAVRSASFVVSTDMGRQKIQRATERERRARLVEARDFVAVEAVTRGIDLDLDLCALRRTQLPGVLERGDRIALAEMHQHWTARLLGDVGADLGGVVADRGRDTVDVDGGAPGNRAAPAIAERCELSRSVQTSVRRGHIREHLIPRDPAAQLAARRRILLRIPELGPETDAVEQR